MNAQAEGWSVGAGWNCVSEDSSSSFLIDVLVRPAKTPLQSGPARSTGVIDVRLGRQIWGGAALVEKHF